MLMKYMLMTAVVMVVIGAVSTPAFAQTDLYSQSLFTYDDSWQPPNCEWKNEAIFGLPSLHCGGVRALRHEITLVAKGPNNQYIQSAVNGCMQEAAAAGVVAGVGAAVASGGAALPAAWQAFQNYFFGCLAYKGVGAVAIGIEDRSHWTQ